MYRELTKLQITEIEFFDGERIVNAIIDMDAPRLPGFIAINSRNVSVKDAADYISVNAIKKMTIKHDEIMKDANGYYFSPDMRVRVTNK